MIDSAYHRKIAKQARKLDQEKIDNEKKVGLYEVNEQPPPAHNTLTKITGYEKEYLKQIPVVGSGKPNMELERVVRGRGRPKKGINANNLGMIYQSQLDNFKGGAMDVEGEMADLERTDLKRALGAGRDVNEELLQQDLNNFSGLKKKGGAKHEPEIIEGSILVAAVKPRGRKGKKEKSVSPVREKTESPKKEVSNVKPMTRRALKVKEIMKSKGLSMIAASKYIKDNGVKY
jgi:hypothetical protein